MANNSFDREIINVRERPLSSDILTGSSEMDFTIREALKHLLASRSNTLATDAAIPAQGFLADSFQIELGTALQIALKPGIGFMPNSADVPFNINSVIGLDDRSILKPVVLVGSQPFTVPAPDAVQNRYDLIEVQYSRQVTDPSSRDILNTITGQFVPNMVAKTLTFTLDGNISYGGVAAINYKTGTLGGGLPAASPGYMAIGAIHVKHSVSSITEEDLIDLRPTLTANGVLTASICFDVDLNPLSGTYKQILAGTQSLPPGYKAAVELVVTSHKTIVFFLEGPDITRLGIQGGMPSLNITTGTRDNSGTVVLTTHATSTLTVSTLLSQPLGVTFPNPLPIFSISGARNYHGNMRLFNYGQGAAGPITIVGTAGPFLVNAIGTAQTLTWNEDFTNVLPIRVSLIFTIPTDTRY